MLYDKITHRFSQSLTGIFLFACMALAFISPKLGLLDYLDNQLFHIGTWLLPQPDVSNDIYTVNISPDYMKNPDEIKTLRSALNRLKANKAASVSLLLSPLPTMDYQRVEPDPKDKKDGAEEKEWELSRGELTKLAWTIDKNKVLTGSALHEASNYFPSKHINENYHDYFSGIIFSRPGVIPDSIASHSSVFLSAPYLKQNYNYYRTPLLWSDKNNNITASLALEIFKRFNHTKSHSWNNLEGIKLKSKLIQTDYSGSIMSFASSAKPEHIISLSKLLSLSINKIKNKIFIFGDNENELLTTTSHLSSLITDSYYHTPAWTSWSIKTAFVFIFFYLLFLVSKLQRQTGYLLTLLLLLSAAVVQYGLLITQSIWLPLAGLYAFLLLGHLSILLKKSIDTQMDALKLHSHDALWQLSQYQFEQEDFDKAASNLLRCSPTSDVLELMYNIGQRYERLRQYEKALYLYSDLSSRNANFKDVKKRLNSLMSISSNTSDISAPMQGTKTLIMPDLGLQLPTLGRYEIERELGRGAMGVVYLGKDPKINRQVAIKTLDYSQFSEAEVKAFKSRFFREAEAAGRLNHPEIVTVFDVGEEVDFAFIAMDYISGQTLSEYTTAGSLLPIREVYEIIAVVAEALDYAHGQSIIHRDIKPGNIMYDAKTHKIKITDFGIARIADNVHTRTGTFLGSPSYMAPEQMTGSNVKQHADIYALGVTFYQLLTGCLPFKADNIGKLAYAIANEKHKPVRSIRPELPSSATRIINKALQKKPRDRFQSGKEMAEAIRRGMPKN